MKKISTLLLTALVTSMLLSFSGCSGDAPIPEEFTKFAPLNYDNVEAGDFIMADGSVCKQADYVYTMGIPVAVIIKKADVKTGVLGIGIKEAKNLKWCAEDCKGYTQGASKLYSKTKNINQYDYTDSTTSYEVLLSHCTDATDTSKYPAWEYCFKYGVTNNYTGYFTTGWTLPTVYELLSVDGSDWLTAATSLGKIPYPKSDSLSPGENHATCNQESPTQCLIYKIVTSGEGTGSSQLKTNAIPHIRPIYHFDAALNVAMKPVYSSTGGTTKTVTLRTYTKNAKIKYKLDSGAYIASDSDTVTFTTTDNITVHASSVMPDGTTSEEISFTVTPSVN